MSTVLDALDKIGPGKSVWSMYPLSMEQVDQVCMFTFIEQYNVKIALIYIIILPSMYIYMKVLYGLHALFSFFCVFI